MSQLSRILIVRLRPQSRAEATRIAVRIGLLAGIAGADLYSLRLKARSLLGGDFAVSDHSEIRRKTKLLRCQGKPRSQPSQEG